MNYAVTGAAGFIGTNLVRHLLSKGKNVRGIDNFSKPVGENSWWLGAESFYADLRDYSHAKAALKGIDVVYHLAARVGSLVYLHGSNIAELDTLQTNLTIDANVFRACRENEVRKLIYASSVAVYPISMRMKKETRFAEEDVRPLNPDGGYGWAKYMGELQIGLMSSIKCGVARIFNTYGEYDDFGPNAHVVPSLIRKAARFPKERFVLQGNGTQRRSLMHISDCVAGLESIEQHLMSTPIVMNIGSQNSVSVNDLAKTIIELSGKQITIEFDFSIHTGPSDRVPDITAAVERLGWKPKVGLYQGLRRTFDWYLQTYGT